ncbi:hypothetical protein [Nocardioides yefusunii]|uniref:LPXTG cell wall anchor domain-containing protein n=1 Tax=Nocardioides yefusunii TaxID=2500546 RepID=A0ABW1QVQ0_9ACTN|nr:hypothetical protein [Nocardioides yefusunii]
MSVKRAAVATTLGLAAASLATQGLVSGAVAADSRGVSGEVSLDCLLQPFVEGFRYEGPMAVKASRVGDSYELLAQMPSIPGIAPVAIDGGRMRVVLEGSVGKEPFTLTGTRSVDAEASSPVPVPDLVGTIPAIDGDVELSKFTFEFDEMMGLTIEAGCDPWKATGLGELTAGAEPGAVTSTEEASADVITVDDEGSAMPLILGGGAVVLALGGVAAWFVSRRRPA